MKHTAFSIHIQQGIRVVIVALVPAKGDENAPLIAAAVGDIEAAGGVVVATLIQRRGVSRARKPGGARAYRNAMNAATFIGVGKAQELAKLVSEVEADVIVFCNLLSKTQKRNVEEIVGAPVILYAYRFRNS